MNFEHRNLSITLSIILHLIMLWAIISWRSTHILVPSRSNGMEVSLISDAEITPIEKPLVTPQTTTPIQTVTTQGEINLKQNATPPAPPPSAKVVVPKAKPTPPKPVTVVPKKVNKKLTNPQLNELLDQIATPTKSSGKTKGRTTGGIATGTSNSNNLINNYADQVINLVRPYVMIPDGINSNVSAIVQVTLLPNMQVYEVKLIKSSGNSDYDINVQQAITRVKVFPALPAGASWEDYRKLKLTFRPE